MTKPILIGIMLTLITASSLVFLVFSAQDFFSGWLLANIIAFQLSFIWTCAEIIDRGVDEAPQEDENSLDRNFSP